MDSDNEFSDSRTTESDDHVNKSSNLDDEEKIKDNGEEIRSDAIKTISDGTCGVTSPSKRSHSTDTYGAKKIKTEPEIPCIEKSCEDARVDKSENMEEANGQPENPLNTLQCQGSSDTETQGFNANIKQENIEDTSPNPNTNSRYIILDPEAYNAHRVETNCSSDENAVKKERLSPDKVKDVKNEDDFARAGHNQPGTSNNGVAAPPGPGRERCIYGANCYRKNLQHKSTFSHPGDADYGSGDRGVCPYGASCCRRDPRHWAQHQHPPNVDAPPPLDPGLRVVQRRGQIFYINANAVHFHNDYFEVEDDDGDSVDYDYEF